MRQEHFGLFFVFLCCYVSQSSAFFWKVRFIYSTLDPEPRWPPRMLRYFDAVYKYNQDLRDGKITHKDDTTLSVSQRAYQDKVWREEIESVTTRELLLENVSLYGRVWFGTWFNILGHHWENLKCRVSNAKQFLQAHLFIRDPKAKDNMLYNVGRNSFHIMRNGQYINERYRSLYDKFKTYSSQIGKMTKNYFKYCYPDGFLQTHFNNLMGYPNPKLEEMLKNKPPTTTEASTTTKIYDAEYFKTFTLVDHNDKKKKK